MASRTRVPSLLLKHMARTGMSPEQLGPRVGVSGRTIRRVVNGDPVNFQFRTKAAIAEELGKDPTDIWPLISLKRECEREVSAR